MPAVVQRVPVVGLLPVLDPRIDPELQQRMLDYLKLEERLRELGVDEVGLEYEVVCDAWNDDARRRLLAWIRACRIKQLGSRSWWKTSGTSPS
jgi:hypothetical protein